MNTLKVILTINIFCGILFSSFCEESPKQKINFVRKQHIGDVLECDISSQFKGDVTMIYSGSKKNKREQLINSLKLKGKLYVKSVSKTGNSDKLEFKVSSAEGVVRNEKYKPDWIGKTLVADLNFSPCKFTVKGEDKPLSKKDIILLSLVFRHVQKKNMASFIGFDKKVGVGDSWDAPAGARNGLIKRYADLGLKLPPENISGKVKIKSRKEYKGIDCWEIEEQLSVVDIPKLGFGFKVEILLPVDDNFSTVKLFREGIEKIEKIPKGNHPMMQGIEKIIIIRKDEMTAEMIPVKNITKNKKE